MSESIEGDDHKGDILKDVHKECIRQEELWGKQHHPTFPTVAGRDRLRFAAQAKAEGIKRENAQRAATGYIAWDLILLEEVFEALAEDGNPDTMITELTQVAAVAVTMIEDLKRNGVWTHD